MKSFGHSQHLAQGGSVAPISRLQAIVEMIDSPGKADFSCLWEPFGAYPSAVKELLHSTDSKDVDSKSHETLSPSFPALKIHVAEETSAIWEDSPQVAPSQIQQLIQHVRSRKKDLDQREADLQGQVYRWEQEVMTVKAKLKRKSAALGQQQDQLNLQRAQLIKLQQNLIDTQTALRALIENIVEECEEEELKLQLGKLRFELNESMDSILKRWEKLTEGLASPASAERFE